MVDDDEKNVNLRLLYFLELYVTWVGAQYFMKSQKCQEKKPETETRS